MSTTQVELNTIPVPGVRSGPLPEKFFETMVAYQRTAALKAAIDLDLFTAIGNGQKPISALAKQLKGSERGVRILCDCLVVIGFLTKDKNGYGLTADSAAFLDMDCGLKSSAFRQAVCSRSAKLREASESLSL